MPIHPLYQFTGKHSSLHIKTLVDNIYLFLGYKKDHTTLPHRTVQIVILVFLNKLTQLLFLLKTYHV